MPADARTPSVVLRADPRAGRTLARLARWAVGFVVVGCLVGWLVLATVPGPFETAVLGAVADVRTDFGVALLRAVSIATNLGVTLLLVAIAVPLLRWRTGGWGAAWLLILTYGGALLTTGAIKLLVGRARPIDALISAHSAAFPSGHSSRAAALAALGMWATTTMVRRPAVRSALSVLLIGAALAVGWSRLYLGIHWPSDILAGFVLGVAWVLVLLHVLEPVVTGARSPTRPERADTDSRRI